MSQKHCQVLKKNISTLDFFIFLKLYVTKTLQVLKENISTLDFFHSFEIVRHKQTAMCFKKF